ncbi:hypothetical protein PP175_00605 [Aneurinibacillus sp. Ricciae_BoGa-3]|uniref:hypothetical protein n=1 Tax=Aneurinibacillus sp. Ricciae_BoGa-3 TaxID=3022697 RepID=UPI0023405A07|nr:hypothetical protein [Aneurinibacillus sp. Ricciae_BoGa-3]WCK54600.1 hypothetical protein PP175_00605 [Aneurinibacillus sp. Ricciae_BoGa-3]
MAQKNKIKNIELDNRKLINELEKTPYSTNLVEEIEQDEVNYRDTGVRDEDK